MSILLADSPDGGETWSPWRVVPMPADVGPPSLTNALIRFPSGRLVLSVETNKEYLDDSPLVPARRPSLVRRRRRHLVGAGHRRVGPDRPGRELGPARRRGARWPAGELFLDLRLRGGRLPGDPAADQRGRGSHLRRRRPSSTSPTSRAIPPSSPTGGSSSPGSIASGRARSALAWPRASTRRSTPTARSCSTRPTVRSARDAVVDRDDRRRPGRDAGLVVWPRLTPTRSPTAMSGSCTTPRPETAGSTSAGSGWPSMADEAGGPMDHRHRPAGQRHDRGDGGLRGGASCRATRSTTTRPAPGTSRRSAATWPRGAAGGWSRACWSTCRRSRSRRRSSATRSPCR